MSESCRAVTRREPRLGALSGVLRNSAPGRQFALRNLSGLSGASPYQSGSPQIADNSRFVPNSTNSPQFAVKNSSLNDWNALNIGPR